MNRRGFLKSVGVSTAAVLVSVPKLTRSQTRAPSGASAPSGWRTFEVTTRVEVVNPSGVTRVWLPAPMIIETDYQKPLGDKWNGNASVAKLYRDEKDDGAMLYSEWKADEKEPVVELVSRFSTRDRSLDLSHPPRRVAKESKARLARYLEPTKFLPLDGVVLETSRNITGAAGAKNDMDKARAIYDWIVENTFRDPKTPGCGLGDIKTMLETRYFGGKCADLNALFVGLTRAAGIPARDLYGVRVADSKEFKSLGRRGDITQAQHCRAEFYHADYGWVPVDPADVRKVMLEEKPGLTLDDPIAKRARAKLFGAWEMNYLGYNHAHDVKLPNSTGAPLPFFMYPQGETAEGRKDPLDPPNFKYRMTSREISS